MGTLYQRTKGGIWQAEYTEHTGRRRQRSTRTRDKRAAKQILQHGETESARRATGQIDAGEEHRRTAASQPITRMSRQWLATLRSAGRSDIHIERSESHLNRAIEAAQWRTIADISAAALQTYTASLKDSGAANQTVGHYLQAVKQFSRWLWTTDQLATDPLKSVRKPSPSRDRRRRSRMLLPEEWPWLRDAAAERGLLYHLAIQTGLRRGELASLCPSDLRLDAEPPYVIAAAGQTKNGELARQYLSPSLASQLRAGGLPEVPSKDQSAMGTSRFGGSACGVGAISWRRGDRG